jgi:hypothetical protein
MSLLDSIDGSFMNFAYGWAFSEPVRKVYYNITVTGLSVAVAMIIGGIELISILADKLSITGGPIGWIAALDLNLVGYVIVGLFIATWVLALAVWKLGRIEERWNTQVARLETAEQHTGSGVTAHPDRMNVPDRPTARHRQSAREPSRARRRRARLGPRLHGAMRFSR